MDKFGRNYSLEVQAIDGSLLTIELPFTLEFDIQKNNLGSANAASFRIYNLSKNHRSALRFDAYQFGNFRSLILKAGYGSDLSTIFNGNISQAWSVREGNNFITELQCFDGGFALTNAKTGQTAVAGTTTKEIIQRVFNDLKPYSVSTGAIGNSFNPVTISRGRPYSGATKDILNELTSKGFFINDSKAYALGDGDYIPGQFDTINSETGLIGTPLLNRTTVTIDMIFEPRLIMYQKVALKSVADAIFNRDYKVIGIQHRGMISPAVCGVATTHVTLNAGLLNLVENS